MSIISVQNGDVYVSSQDEVGQIAGDYATQSYVNSAISTLIDGAPASLDTLNELAAALSDDSNFASTVVLKAGSTMTGALVLNADPTVNLGAATKQYVDNVVTSASGTVTSVASGTGLTGGPITTSGTLNVDVGTTANKIVQLDSSAKIPAIDGSQLTNLPAQSFSSITGKPTTISGYGITDAVTDLDDLGDVDISSLGVRELLWYEGASVGGATPVWGSQELNLSDSMFANLAITSLSDNEFLKYDSSTSKWINSAIPAQSFSSLTGKPTTISGYGITDGVTLTGTETLTNKTLTNPVMRQITGDSSFGAYSGDRLQFTTNYQGSWSYGSTGPAENWNTDLLTKSWQDPGNNMINVYQLATAEDKNLFRINTFNEGTTVNAGSFVTGKKYIITSLGNTTQAQWEAAGLSSTLTAAVNNVFTATGAGTGTGTVKTWDNGSHSVGFSLKGGDDVGFEYDGNFVNGVRYEIYTLGDTDWNTVAGTSGVTYAVGDEFITDNSGGTGTGVAIDLRANAGKINSFDAYTSTSSTPHPTNIQFLANKLSFKDIHGNHQFDFPRKDGTANQVITTDGAGRLTFQNAPVSNLSILSDDQQFINGSAQGQASANTSLRNGVLNISTDNSGWDHAQLMLSDSNNKVVAITAEEANNKDRFIITFDPDGDNDTSGGNTGDYGHYMYKDYGSGGSLMGWDIYGAQNGFNWTINGDRNGDVDAYDKKPLTITAGDFTVFTRDAYNSSKQTLNITKDMVQPKVPLNLKSYTVAEANALTNIDSGSLIWVSNGNAGAGTVAVYNGSDWKVLPYTDTISA